MSGAAMRASDAVRRSSVAALTGCLPPPYIVLPPTTRFGGIAVAHGDYGLCAVVVHDEPAWFDEASGRWYGSSTAFDPEMLAAQAALDLATAARAPAERVTGLVWLASCMSQARTPATVCASTEPETAAYMIGELMRRTLSGHGEPVAPWLAAYVDAACGPKEPMSKSMRRLSLLVERCLTAEFEERVAVIENVEVAPHDLADPRFLLPAVLSAVHEDLAILHAPLPGRPAKAPVRGKPAFGLSLVVDPGAFLGYRVQTVTPAHPMYVLGPVVALARRYRFHQEYLFDDVLGQFGRFLLKHGLDATVVDDAAGNIRARQEGRG